MSGINKIIDKPFYSLQLRSDGIVQFNCKGHTYSAGELFQMLDVFEEITQGRKAGFLFVAQESSMLDISALKFFNSPKATMFSSKEAYVLSSKAQCMLADFFLKFSPVPGKAFRSVDEAVNWLHKS